MKIINLTQHAPTAEQIEAGVFDPRVKSLVQDALTFEQIPSAIDIGARADQLARIAMLSGATSAMIGGAPFFMSALERALIDRGVEPIYAFSERVSVEKTMTDGSVHKTNVFKHVGFVRPYETADDTVHAGACTFCGGDIVVPHGHSFGSCHQCGAI